MKDRKPKPQLSNMRRMSFPVTDNQYMRLRQAGMRGKFPYRITRDVDSGVLTVYARNLREACYYLSKVFRCKLVTVEQLIKEYQSKRKEN